MITKSKLNNYKKKIGNLKAIGNVQSTCTGVSLVALNPFFNLAGENNVEAAVVTSYDYCPPVVAYRKQLNLSP